MKTQYDSQASRTTRPISTNLKKSLFGMHPLSDCWGQSNSGLDNLTMSHMDKTKTELWTSTDRTFVEIMALSIYFREKKRALQVDMW